MRYTLQILRFLATLTAVVVAGWLGVMLWESYMLAPWTRDGRVIAQVVGVAPEVPGTITEVRVRDNQFVHRGDVLFVIDPVRFRLAIREAQSHLDAARHQEDLHQSDVRRRLGLTGIVSAEEQERVQSTAAVSGAALSGAEAELDVAKLNLQRSVLYSPVDGWVTHLRVRVGDYATVGKAVVSVVDANSFWVDGYFEETKLAHISVGDPARIKLMGYRQPLLGHVESIGRGISDPDDQVNARGLPTVNPVFTWVRLAQRIPVHVDIDKVPDSVHLAAGLTASISIGPEEMDRAADTSLRGRLYTWLRDRL